MAYLRRGKCHSFFCCLRVFLAFSCYIQDVRLGLEGDIMNNNDEGGGGENNGGANKKSTNLGELSADCTSLLWSEIDREILLALVELAQVLALLRVHNSQDASDRLADTIAIGRKVAKIDRCRRSFILVVGKIISVVSYRQDADNDHLCALTYE